ncbi:MAG: hypothetical protein AUI58_06595 [Chloroflexi bacterium 13_1_40CM_2_70_6]|nr:MAG: hypothetical protein AUI58_06595 [Chloroflexi bacterium 13_1_40CM_2_70_6]
MQPAVRAEGEKPATREMFYAEALGDALRLEMRRDPNVLVFGEDIAQHGGAFGVTKGWASTSRGSRAPVPAAG